MIGCGASSELVELGHSGKVLGNQLFSDVAFPPKVTTRWVEQVKNEGLLIALKFDSAVGKLVRRCVVFLCIDTTSPSTFDGEGICH